MKKSLFVLLAAAFILISLAAPMAAQATAQAGTQDKPVDMTKLLAEIVGDYEFSVQGQSLLVQFTQVEGKLFGAPPGETPEQIMPVEGKALCFDVTLAQSGAYYQLEFVRNDKGVIDKCVMNVQGMVVEGLKVIK